MSVPKLNGVLETALYVDDLKLSLSFYKKIFEFETLHSDERLCALSVSNKQVLLLFLKRASNAAIVSSGGVIPPHDGDGDLHLAFSIATSDLEQWKNWLRDNNIEIESEYKWTRGATSLYFRDPDNHLLELATPGLWIIY
ncbi:MAG: VOC family protein [Pyrinomonadaceae bacterium MAG19_C2-C3]|nr:VOC family protein [Pyrinomonadaceae bacterium MAG19_C2-C3]